MMIDDDFYNKLCMLLFQEEVRLKNNVVDAQNYILKYTPTDPLPYMKLYAAQSVSDYYNIYISSFMQWLEHYIGKGDC